MALRADVQYVSYGIDGTAAKKVERHVGEGHAAPVYKRRKAEHKVIAVNPLALAGMALSVILLVAMVVGLVQYQQVLEDSRQMSQYVQQLQQENVQLEQTYRDGYDLDEIRQIAEQAGMVAAENVEQISVSVQKPEQEEAQMSFWKSLTTFLTGIFA